MLHDLNQSQDNIYALKMRIKDTNYPSSQQNIKISAKNKQLRLVYGNQDKFIESCKNKFLTKDQFAKTSSCFSTNSKYDYAGDIIDHSTYSFKTQQPGHQQSKRKKIRLIRSADNKKILQFNDGDIQKLFQRASIHTIKKKHEFIAKNRKNLESQYSFILKKIDHLKKVRIFEEKKSIRLSIIKKQNRTMSLQLKTNQLIDNCKRDKHKQYIKTMVQQQRDRRRDKVNQKRSENSLSASQVRQFSKEHHDQLKKLQQSRLKMNRKRCLREKKNYKKRMQNIASKTEQRKQKAKFDYRINWINELEMIQNEKKQFFQKKSSLIQNMKKAIQSYKDIISKNNI